MTIRRSSSSSRPASEAIPWILPPDRRQTRRHAFASCDGGRMPKGSAYFAGSAVFHSLGPSFAVLLFAQIEPVGVAWLRIATAAAIYAVWRRPRRFSRDAIAMGVVLGAMNPV